METEEVIQKLKDDVAAHMRAMRAFRNKTQEEVAKIAGISRAGLSMIEQGKANPQIATLGKISAVLGFSLIFNAIQQLTKD